MHERTQAIRVINGLVRTEISENAQQCLLANVLDQIRRTNLCAQPEPDDGAEMGKELPFRIRVAAS